jgi:hypothetical protein
MSSGHFESVRAQIGCCGIWCGSCVVGNGALAELTRRYERLLELHDLRNWGPKDFDHDQFAQGLRSIRSMAPRAGCLRGGGRDSCELRSCARARELADCTECGGRGQCPHAGLLGHMRSGAARAGLSVREPGSDRERSLRGWMEEIRSRWPQSVLFDGQSDRW